MDYFPIIIMYTAGYGNFFSQFKYFDEIVVFLLQTNIEFIKRVYEIGGKLMKAVQIVGSVSGCKIM